MIIIAGPCQLETKEHALNIANTMKKICDDNGLIIYLRLVLIKQIELVLEVKEV